MIARFKPAKLLTTLDRDGTEWCQVADGVNLYWTPYREGMLVPCPAQALEPSKSLDVALNAAPSARPWPTVDMSWRGI